MQTKNKLTRKDLSTLLTLTGNKRLPHLEDEIFANTKLTCMYLSALHDMEISKEDISWEVYRYAKDVIKGRWPEAEPIIKTNPQVAHWYAASVNRISF